MTSSPAPSLSRSLPRLLSQARIAGRETLLEPEAMELARELGLGVPVQRPVRSAREVAALDLGLFPGSRLVLKVMSPGLLHKSDVGGVTVIDKHPRALADAVAAMERRFSATEVEGFLVCEWVQHDEALGGELLLGLRHTSDFGPVVVLGAGGLDAEHLAAHLRPGRALAVFSPAFSDPELLAATLDHLAVGALAVAPRRGHAPRLERRRLIEVLGRALEFAEAHLPHDLAELELNPVALTDRGPIALDAVARRGEPAPEAALPRPLELLDQLLEPRTIAVAGVSRRRNPGRIIVDNVLAEGFPRDRLRIVKPGVEEFLGCRAVPSFAALPESVDLAVLAIDAAGAVAALSEIVEHRKAASVILIPGGLGERAGSEERAGQLRSLLDRARRGEAGAGPVINGGNCLGVRSRPGRYDTMFIPRHKLSFAPRGSASAGAPLAVVAQSGAFAVARASSLEDLDPLYLVSLGNQIDLTVGDYLTYLAADPRVEIFACYVEGFRPGDGRRFLEAARRVIADGRTVILYRAGRTSEGARASASHTASLAGDWAVTRGLAHATGVVVAESVEEFADLVRLFCCCRGRRLTAAPGRRRLAALSNAGFECVAVADNLGEDLELAQLDPATTAALDELLRCHRLDAIVEARNPLDVTPILDDAAFVEAARLLLSDPGVDLGAVGCVPLTGALQTLSESAHAEHDENLDRSGGLVDRLVGLWRGTDRPWVVAIDGGPRYDPLARRLERSGLPVFRAVDRAVKALGRYARHAPGRVSAAGDPQR